MKVISGNIRYQLVRAARKPSFNTWNHILGSITPDWGNYLPLTVEENELYKDELVLDNDGWARYKRTNKI